MKHLALKVGLVPVVGHLLFGAVLLIIDAVHGVNDQDVSYALMLMFYYLNYSGVLLIRYFEVQMDIDILPLILAGLVQWIVIGAVVGGIASLLFKKKGEIL